MSLLLIFFVVLVLLLEELVVPVTDAVSSDTCDVMTEVLLSVLPESGAKCMHSLSH